MEQPRKVIYINKNHETTNLSLILTALFAGLRVAGYIDWHWIWVVSPLWLPFAIFLGFAAVIVIGAGVIIGFAGIVTGVTLLIEWVRDKVTK